jgi:hypothetical protein
MPKLVRPAILLCLILCFEAVSAADPWAAPGDMALRHDLQVLADAGVLGSPVLTWPIPWSTIQNDLSGYVAGDVPLNQYVANALERVRRRLASASNANGIELETQLASNSSQSWFRTFESMPREEFEAGASGSWIGKRFAARLQMTYAADADDDEDLRWDGSYLAVVLGNHILSAGRIDRWWGPGWEGSLIYGTNQRPVPTIALERRQALPFKTKWLSWIGPWTYSLSIGELEHGRTVPNANLLGFRVAFRPVNDVEIALTRTAQWCGNDRPCDLDSLWDLIKGDDNVGSEGIDTDNEPGNQLAAIDIRWNSPFSNLPYALYTQWTAEDESSGTPSRWTAQIGAEVWGSTGLPWIGGDYRFHVEYADTATSFYKDTIRFDTAYEHGIYSDGYRYRDRVIGHAMDNDGQMVTFGGLLVDAGGGSWNALLRWIRVNRGGAIPNRNQVSQEELDVRNFEISRKQRLAVFGRDLGAVAIGGGYYYLDNKTSGGDDDSWKAFLQWSFDL